MDSLKLKENFYWIGAQDKDLRVFDIIMETQYGTSYNSFLLKTSEGVVLFETVKEKFCEQYLEKIKTLVDISEIKYIVVNHTEPDHAGSVERILKLVPNVKIIGSPIAIKYLNNICNCEFDSITVKDHFEYKIGEYTLQFKCVPFLHWPDSIYTYIKELNTLVTCDSFGAHYAFDDVLSSKVTNESDYMDAYKYYYDMIMGPFKKYVLSALDKISDLNIDLICTGHGPVIDKDFDKYINLYREWSTEKNINVNKTVVIPYVSAYGYTKSIAEKIGEGIKTKADVDVKLFDLVESDISEVLNEIKWADGIIVGSPTINGDALLPIMNLLIQMSPITHGKKLGGAFGSYGWSGEAVGNIEQRLKQLRVKLFDDGLKVEFKPTEIDLDKALDYGKRFALEISSK